MNSLTYRHLLLSLSLLALPVVAQDNLPKIAEVFDIAGNKAFVYAAPTPATGKPWLWYAPTLKGVSLFGRKFYFEPLMKAGISLAGFDLGEVRGSQASTAKFTLFYEEMVKRGYSKKPILLGQSRGGMMTLAWAFRNPDKVKAWVGIYPVCNLASWPLKNSKKDTLADFAMPEADLVARLAEFNPIDNLAPLAEARVPLLHVCGSADEVVPLEENTELLAERYKRLGGHIEVIEKPGVGHHPHSLKDPTPIVEFILRSSEQP